MPYHGHKDTLNRELVNSDAGQLIHFIDRVVDIATRKAPAAQWVAMIINDAEPAVSNGQIDRLMSGWKAHGKVVQEVHLDSSYQLPHDLIKPEAPGGHIDYVYPILLKVLDGDLPDQVAL
jgi:hypothetical protein